jgi:hypothetical protein
MGLKQTTTTVFILLGLLSFGLNGLAAVQSIPTKSKKKQSRRTLQVYSAYEHADEIAPAPPLSELSEVSEIKVAKAASPQIQQPDPYFTVPTRQMNLIAARLHVIEAILLESGRAYDYRSHTMSELKSILLEIRAQKRLDQRLAE